ASRTGPLATTLPAASVTVNCTLAGSTPEPASLTVPMTTTAARCASPGAPRSRNCAVTLGGCVSTDSVTGFPGDSDVAVPPIVTETVPASSVNVNAGAPPFGPVAAVTSTLAPGGSAYVPTTVSPSFASMTSNCTSTGSVLSAPAVDGLPALIESPVHSAIC